MLAGSALKLARELLARADAEDARVYGGDHWGTGGTDGTALGDALAEWALKRHFRRSA